MYRPALTVFVIFAALALAQGTSFKRIDLHNGLAHLPINERSLADATLYKYAINATTSNTSNPTVNIDLGAGLEAAAYPYASVAIYLHTSVSGLVKAGCPKFGTYACTDANGCTVKDSSNGNYWASPYMKAYGGMIAPTTFNIKTSDSSTPWKLTNTVFYTSLCSSSLSFLPNLINAYGWIGLGIDAGANTNFQTTLPIFSVSIDKTGSGSIYFGVNSTITSSAKGSTITLPPSSNNWDFQVDSINFGSLQVLNLAANNNNLRIIFDINYPGIGFPDSSTYYFSDTKGKFTNTLDIVNAINQVMNLTYNTSASSYYYLNQTALAALPNINFTLVGGNNVSIPAFSLFQEMSDMPGNYSLAIKRDSQISGADSSQPKVDYIVLGRSFFNQFYTVFQNTTSNGPQISLYPLNSFTTTTTTTSSGSSSSKTLYIIIAAVVLVLIIGFIVLKGKSASKVSSLSNFAKKPSTGFELR